MRPTLILALDVSALDSVRALLKRLPPGIRWVKVGLELFAAEGPRALRVLRRSGFRIFLDLKLHDIPRTVARAVTAAARHGADMVTLHAAGGAAMLREAAAAAALAGPARPKLVAVTALTSLDAADLRAVGVHRRPQTQALALTRLALRAGLDGVVASALEARALRVRFGPTFLLVTPGIRPADGCPDDQKRIATPALAVRSGASFLVVGRPILAAADPPAAARRILAEMRGARSC